MLHREVLIKFVACLLTNCVSLGHRNGCEKWTFKINTQFSALLCNAIPIVIFKQCSSLIK